ncbi:MAG: hypothetical protein LBN95_02515 [Prevotellaceae bacterium]|jgi:hypothetical protein|nr:hypothetical protein [Prevotellaceae bacterium]
MAKKIGRREFLKKSFVGLGTVLLASKLQAMESATNIFSGFENPPADIPDLMPLYRQAKGYFYEKRYADATALFTQLINENPSVLFLYDGLAKVFGAQQNLLSAAELYKNSVNTNSDNAFFLHRYSLSIRNLCLGNSAQAQQFSAQNNIDNLYENAAEQLLNAVAINPKTQFQLDLKDFVKLLEKYNQNPRNSSQNLILSDNIITQIDAVTHSVSNKWTKLRRSRQPNIPSENNYNSNGNGRGHGRHNRHYNNNEQRERENSERKSKKRACYQYFKNNERSNNANKVEQWGFQILNDDIKDTNIVGKMRKYFKQNNKSDKVIAVNRHFYNNNNNVYSALALAASLMKYKNNTQSINEAKTLLNSVNQYINNFTSIAKGAYYNTLAQIKIKENNKNAARATLIEGIALFDGKGGIAYSLMSRYAASYDKNNEATKAISIQKMLCNKTVTQISDPVWSYLEKYRNYLNDNEINNAEKVKALIALSKLQQKFNDSGYSATMNEINGLRM